MVQRREVARMAVEGVGGACGWFQFHCARKTHLWFIATAHEQKIIAPKRSFMAWSNTHQLTDVGPGHLARLVKLREGRGRLASTYLYHSWLVEALGVPNDQSYFLVRADGEILGSRLCQKRWIMSRASGRSLLLASESDTFFLPSVARHFFFSFFVCVCVCV